MDVLEGSGRRSREGFGACGGIGGRCVVEVDVDVLREREVVAVLGVGCGAREECEP